MGIFKKRKSKIKSRHTDIKLTFLGAAQNVTGSRYLLEANGTKILVDCGLYQERQFLERNWEPFPVPPSNLNAVLLTHAHLDHCGLLPKLVKDGFSGKIYCTAATAELARIILLDSAKLQEEDAEFKRKRHEKEGRTGQYPEVPLYTVQDAQNCFPLFAPVNYNETVEISESLSAVFHDAGHVLGSSMIKVTARMSGRQRTILFSGDVGRPGRPMLRDPSVFANADYVLIESTYGDRLHTESEDSLKILTKAINDTKRSGGNIIVPSFALERSQEILYYLNQLLMQDAIPHIMVFLNSPMATKITEVFKEHTELLDDEMADLVKRHQSPFNFPGLKMVSTTEESKAINHIKGTVMVIAGSGMCNGGRIKHHLVNNISRPESTIIFVGYQAIGTLGRLIIDGEKTVRILGQQYDVKANIVQVNGFSSHADKNELINWLKNLKSPPGKIFVVHGEENSAKNFAEYIHSVTGWPAETPNYQETVFID